MPISPEESKALWATINEVLELERALHASVLDQDQMHQRFRQAHEEWHQRHQAICKEREEKLAALRATLNVTKPPPAQAAGKAVLDNLMNNLMNLHANGAARAFTDDDEVDDCPRSDST